MTIRAYLAAVFVIIGSALPSAGQTRMSLEIPFVFAVGEYNQVSPNTWGGGFSVNMLFSVRDTPLNLGVEYGYMVTGVVNDQILYSQNGTSLISERRTSQNQFLLSALMRLQLSRNTPRFMPFIDMQLGARYLYSGHIITPVGWDNHIAQKSDIAHWVGSFGIGMGFERAYSKNETVAVRLIYQAGSRADYARRGSYNTDNQGHSLDNVFSSRTDMLVLSFGLTGLFEGTWNDYF